MSDVPPKLSFRFAHESDVDALTHIYVAAVAKTGHVDDPESERLSKRNEVAKRIAKNPTEILIAIQDNQPVAYIMHSVPISSLPHHIHIDDFYAAAPKNKIGGKLFEMFCKLHGEAAAMHLTNRGYASGIYESFGFELENAKDMTMTLERIKVWRDNWSHERPHFPVKGFVPESGM